LTSFRRLSTLLAILSTFVHSSSLAAAEPDYSKDPVLMVHGYFLGEGATWAWMKSALKDNGWPEEYMFSLQFDNVFGCNPQHGLELDAKLKEVLEITGRDKVDILAHSMGAVDVRWHIKNMCGYKYIQDFVCLAGANQGSVVACVDFVSCGADAMCVGPTADAWMQNDFLMDLNFCDMTPWDDILYTSIWTPYDEIIVPQENCMLEGARNIKLESYVEHALILTSPEALPFVIEGLDGGGLNNNMPKAAPPCVTLCQDDPVDPSPEPQPEPSPEPVADVVSLPDQDVTAHEVIAEMASDAVIPQPDLTPGSPEAVSPDKTGPLFPDVPPDTPSAEVVTPSGQDVTAVVSTIPARSDGGCGVSPTAAQPWWLLVLLPLTLRRRRSIWG
jgi:triacylglycerol lipase